jgi:hypothetical protein
MLNQHVYADEEHLIVESNKFRLLERTDAEPQVLFSDVPIGKVCESSPQSSFFELSLVKIACCRL